MSHGMRPDPGWRVFPAETGVRDWVEHAAPSIIAASMSHANARRHGGTWWPGVDALDNDAHGSVAGGPRLSCAALDQAGALPLHRGQVSVVYPGYPGRDEDESDAAHRYRQERDAAHLDGLLPVGPDRRRMIREPHAWILGLPLVPVHTGNAPLVVWEGSHQILRAALRQALQGHDPTNWHNVDVTDAYQTARRNCFEVCRRFRIEAQPGQAILLHRLVLHGVCPWRGPSGPPRPIVYFRPLHPGGVKGWLSAD